MADNLVNPIIYNGNVPELNLNLCLFVDSANGSDTTGSGSITKPYATINAAKNSVTSSADARYTILLMPGVYAPADFTTGYFSLRSFTGEAWNTIIQGTNAIALRFNVTSGNIYGITVRGTYVSNNSTLCEISGPSTTVEESVFNRTSSGTNGAGPVITCSSGVLQVFRSSLTLIDSSTSNIVNQSNPCLFFVSGSALLDTHHCIGSVDYSASGSAWVQGIYDNTSGTVFVQDFDLFGELNGTAFNSVFYGIGHLGTGRAHLRNFRTTANRFGASTGSGFWAYSNSLSSPGISVDCVNCYSEFTGTWSLVRDFHIDQSGDTTVAYDFVTKQNNGVPTKSGSGTLSYNAITLTNI